MEKMTWKTKLLSLSVAVFIILSLMPSAMINVYAADASISSVEVTQVMGKGIDIDNGKYYFMNMFVAEKPTAIQVIMTGVTYIKSASLDIYYEDTLLAITASKDKGDRQIITFIPSKSEVNAWKAGRYKFTANINGESRTTEAIFNDSRTFSVLVISAAVKYQNVIYAAPDIDADSVPLRTQAIPVSESKIAAKFRNAQISFGASENGGYDISTAEGEMSFLSDIEKYRLKSASKYDVVVAVVNSPLGKANGYTDNEHAIVITLAGAPYKEELEATVLHEIGHILGSGDEYINGSFKMNVNGAPYGIAGTENGAKVTGNRSYFTHAANNDYSGILIHEVQNPYNPKSQTAMLERSSFMGSSYKHWTTSMVWEEAYRRLVPNYMNVLPRVYTDGSIVARRSNINVLTELDLNGLRYRYREMLNEVRAAAGLKPYPEDNIMASGEKRLQEVAEEALRQRNFSNLIDLEPMLTSISGDTNCYIKTAKIETALREYAADEIEDSRDFFTLSPCGQDQIKDDYMFIAFVRADNITYFMRSTISDVSPNAAQNFAAQPETPPVPAFNPVTGDIVDPDDFASGKYNAPQIPDIANAKDDTDQTEPYNPNAGLPKYSELTVSERVSILKYSYDKMLIPPEYTSSYVTGFYAWYVTEYYGVKITDSDAFNATQTFAAENKNLGIHFIAFDAVCRVFKLYPPQEMRDTRWGDAAIGHGFEPGIYGNNPKRSKLDTDEVEYDPHYYDWYVEKNGVYDQNGEWRYFEEGEGFVFGGGNTDNTTGNGENINETISGDEELNINDIIGGDGNINDPDGNW